MRRIVADASEEQLATTILGAGAKSASVVVQVDGLNSSPVRVVITAASPGIFSRPTAQQKALPPMNEDGTQNAVESPARAGSVVTLSITGIGSSVGALTALVGGQTAEILDATAVTGILGGLFQVRIRIPPALKGVLPAAIRVGRVVIPPVYLYLPPLPPVQKDFGALQVGARDLVYDPFRNVLYAGTVKRTCELRDLTARSAQLDPDHRSSLA